MFEIYLLAINVTEGSWPDAMKYAILLHILGTEGQQLFYNLSDTGKSTLEFNMLATQSSVHVMEFKSFSHWKKCTPHSDGVKPVADTTCYRCGDKNQA